MTASKIKSARGPIIHLNGYPGVGKLTIARHLVAQLGGSAQLVHNHLLINPADAILNRNEPGYQKLRQGIRAAVFSTLVEEPSTFEKTYIFTDFQSGSKLGTSVCAEYVCAAEAREAAFIPILVSCNEKANMERLVSGDREQHMKLTSVELVTKFRNEGEIHRFTGHPNWFEIDVSAFEPEEAAARICEHVRKVCS